MIQLFRKIRHRLLQENRFSKYLLYAVGEIILVVIGILIALGINNWNQTNKAKEREQMYLISFREDLLECQQELERVFSKTKQVSESCQLLLAIGSGTQPMPNPRSFDSLVGRTFGYTIAMTNEGTLNDIKQSGDLKVIQNDTLRRAMASWEAGYKVIREREALLKDAFLDRLELFKPISDQNKDAEPGAMFLPSHRRIMVQDTVYRNNLGNMDLNASVLNQLYRTKILQLDTLLALTERGIQR